MVRRVTKDWAVAFPGFAVWRPLHLLRRIGPAVQGICLDRSTSGDGYLPTAHVHALTKIRISPQSSMAPSCCLTAVSQSAMLSN